MDRKIKLRDLLLKKQEEKFAFENYPKLKTREDYASYKIFTVNRRWWRETAYSFITLAIPTCLTTLSKDADKHGILLFKTIQGYMKDRKYGSKPFFSVCRYNMDGFQLAFEILKILNKTSATPGLRTEVYCQLIKQLTGNPNEMSVSLGWELMAILLYYVLPEEDFMNYLIVYLWNHAPTPDKSLSPLPFSLDSSRSSTTATIPPNTSATATTSPAAELFRAPPRRSASFCGISRPIPAATASRTSSLRTTQRRSSRSPTIAKKAESRRSRVPPNHPV